MLEVDIPTGRSHQIRAHMTEAGHPLFGDGLYGGPRRLGRAVADRQMLHAARLAFPHPVTGEPLSFEVERQWFEYEADAFAKAAMQSPKPLAEALTRLTKDHLGNPTPHPLYVALHYSHPPVLRRLAALES